MKGQKLKKTNVTSIERKTKNNNLLDIDYESPINENKKYNKLHDMTSLS